MTIQVWRRPAAIATGSSTDAASTVRANRADSTDVIGGLSITVVPVPQSKDDGRPTPVRATSPTSPRRPAVARHRS